MSLRRVQGVSGTLGSDAPDFRPYRPTLHISDAGAALFAAIGAPAGVYNIVSDGGRVSSQRFKDATGWRPAV